MNIWKKRQKDPTQTKVLRIRLVDDRLMAKWVARQTDRWTDTDEDGHWKTTNIDMMDSSKDRQLKDGLTAG